ncbi:MAG TPA: ABC transporter permease [Gemmatimonadaceae bacterium]|nr:ABC transporter permease [Gemmatimonadaceae bacterium]
MSSLLHDLRYALRMMRRSPSFTLIAVLCLALGIGATSTIFGIVDALFFRPPVGVGDPGAIVRPYIARRTGNITTGPEGSTRTSYPEYLDLRDNTRSLSGVAAFMNVSLTIGQGTSTEHADGLLVSGNYFTVLQARPALGRFFVPEEDEGPGSPPAVIVSHAYWQRHFGGDPSAVGKTIRIDGHAFPVVGVAQAGFHGIDLEGVDVWIPVSQSGNVGNGTFFFTNRYAIEIQMVGRLKPGMSRERAQAELQGIIRHVASQQDTSSGMRLDPNPTLTLGPILTARGPTLSEQAKIARWLALAAALVLAIACANVANLLLARAAARRKEIALRLSVGASRWRLMRQLLTESLVLATLGTIGGLVLAIWGTRLVPTVGLPPLHFFAQGRVLVFAVAAAVVCGVLFGLAPALGASRTELAAAIKEGAREGMDRRSTLRSSLLVAQVALATVLLMGAGLFVHSLRNVQAVNLGFDAGHLVRADLDLGSVGFPDSAATPFFNRALERVRAVPGVVAATLASNTPFSGGLYSSGYTIPGRPTPSKREQGDAGQDMNSSALTYNVGPEYFSTIGTPMRQGRDFTANDRKGSALVAIVNETFAKKEWPGESPLGKCLDLGSKDKPECHTVVGVAADSKYSTIEESPREAFFVPLAQDSYGRQPNSILIRTRGNPSAVIPSVRHTLQEMGSNLPYPELKTFSDIMRPQLQPRRLGAAMFGVFGLLALVLAAIGLYGVVSYAVEQRTHEVGIRMALGAQARDVLSLVMRQGAVLTVVGLAIGVAGALAAARLIAHLLFGVSATDPVTFIGVVVLLAAVALVASWMPARRATKVDPIIALRSE